jgi:hypothetical protein
MDSGGDNEVTFMRNGVISASNAGNSRALATSIEFADGAQDANKSNCVFMLNFDNDLSVAVCIRGSDGIATRAHIYTKKHRA